MHMLIVVVCVCVLFQICVCVCCVCVCVCADGGKRVEKERTLKENELWPDNGKGMHRKDHDLFPFSRRSFSISLQHDFVVFWDCEQANDQLLMMYQPFVVVYETSKRRGRSEHRCCTSTTQQQHEKSSLQVRSSDWQIGNIFSLFSPRYVLCLVCCSYS